MADSFFPLGQEPGQMALFHPDGHTPGPDAGLILGDLHSGLIDAIHSWGDFNGAPPDPARLRSLAESCTARLLEEGLSVQVWLNHGDPSNLQNLQARLEPRYRGDDPASPFYTADLVRQLGVKFSWCSELVPWPLSPHRPRLIRLLTRLAHNTGKNFLKLLLGRWRLRRRVASITNLCEPVTLADGSRLLAFNRFNRHPKGLWGLPTRHTLRYVLHPKVLGDLLDQEGFLVVYTHLGLPPHPTSELFPGPDLQALAHLAGLYQEGEIWVAPTSRLLTFWLMRRHLIWRTAREGERLIIHLEAVDDPTTGRRLPRVEELAGICFYSPRPEDTSLRLVERELATRIHPADHTGQQSLGLPPAPPPQLDQEVA